MNKLIRLSPTGIEYGDYAWNFASGCGNNISGKCNSGGFNCWAYPITKRFAERYPNGFNPTIYPEALLSPLYLKKPSRILCAFMGDLFWDCPEFDPERKIQSLMPSGKASVTMSLKGWIFCTIKQCPQHTFLFLTKQPQNLPPWSPFPQNAWVGGTVCTQAMFDRTMDYMVMVEAGKRYLSIEPMLTAITATQGIGKSLSQQLEILDWLIIGALTGRSYWDLSAQLYYSEDTTASRIKRYGRGWTLQPKIEWVREIVEAADKAGIPVFLKENLRPLLESEPLSPLYWANVVNDERGHERVDDELRQEMPKVGK